MRKVLIIGATSAIAEAVARRFAGSGDRLHLMARNPERLQDLARDLRVRGATAVDCSPFDAKDHAGTASIIGQAIQSMGGLDVVLIAHGTLPDQKACEASFDLTLQELDTNAISVMGMLTYLANYCEAHRHGTIAVISSVAGDRGRQSNYVYGAAKGAVSVFLQGLRNRLYRSGVRVLTIKPGFVDTPMTASFKKGLLWVSPETIARGIEAAIARGRDVAYLPRFWLPIMCVIKMIPERIFKRLGL